MSGKAQFYAQMAEDTARKITGDSNDWAAFLTTSARVYKYNYYDQLLIFAQRPDSTACAEYDLWNNVMHRYIRKGAKGISLMRFNQGHIQLRYVFDVSDTGETQNSLQVNPWKIKDENEDKVQETLEDNFFADGAHSLSEQLDQIAWRMTLDYWRDNRNQIIDSVDGTTISEYDDSSIGASFRKTVSESIAYVLRSRCGQTTEPIAFPDVSLWNTPAACATLGEAISDISGQVLREIERTIRAYERSVIHERIEVHEARGLPVPGDGTERDGQDAGGQVWVDASAVSGRESSGDVRGPAVERQTDGTPSRDPLLPDDPGSKVNACVNNILRIWREGQDEKLTQLVFCDLSTPRGKAATEKEQNAELLVPEETGTGSINIYDDIRSKLIANGMPAEQIAFIHDANTELRKKELFAKVRSGQVRVLMGSTAKMGAGTNVQDRLIASHDLDCPWRPGDLEQRAGRIVRQGNHNKDVYIYRYVTEGSFDSYLWQTVENKQKFISQIISSKSPVRSCDDVDETALSYAEIKALCAGDPRIKEKMDLDVDVARLRLMKADHQSKQYRLEDQLLKHFPHEIERDKQLIDAFHKDIALLEAHPLPEKDFVGMTVDGQVLTEKEAAGKAILASCKNATKGIPVTVGTYRGMEVSVQYDLMTNHFQMTLCGSVSHRTEVGNSAEGNVIRMDNVLASIPKRLNDTEVHLASMNLQMDAAKAEVGKPFPQEAELKVKSARLAELDAELNMDKQPEKEQAKKEEPER